ncbi:hypothetical protein Vafri_21395, partial [Volvox africanus]
APASRQPLARWDPLNVDVAVRQLLARAPFWSLLNIYGDSGRWNCVQNLTIAQMRQRLPAGHGCLHACVLGTAEPLPQGVWIPTSMVLPLAVLLQALAADDGGGGGGRGGLDYVPPSVADVRYYIEDAVRAVRGRPEAAARLEMHLRRLREPAAASVVPVAPAASGAACGMTRVELDPSAAEFVPTFQSRTTSAAASSQSGDAAADSGDVAASVAAVSTAQAPAASQAGKVDESTRSAAASVPKTPQVAPAEVTSEAGFAAAAVSAGATTSTFAGGSDGGGSRGSDGGYTAAPPTPTPSPAPDITLAGCAVPMATDKALEDDALASQNKRVQQQHMEAPAASRPVLVHPTALQLPTAAPAVGRLALPVLHQQGQEQQKQRGQGLVQGHSRTVPPYQPLGQHRTAHPRPHIPGQQQLQPEYNAVPQQQQQATVHHQPQQQQQVSMQQPGSFQLPQQPQQPPNHHQPEQPEQGGLLVPIPTPFLRFETAVFRLFQGDQGQYSFSSLWWYIEPTADGRQLGDVPRVNGPYSCEQMILAYIAQILEPEVLLCGTHSTVANPITPPLGSFRSLGALLAAAEEGRQYSLLLIPSERAIAPTPSVARPPYALTWVQRGGHESAAATSAGPTVHGQVQPGFMPPSLAAAVAAAAAQAARGTPDLGMVTTDSR